MELWRLILSDNVGGKMSKYIKIKDNRENLDELLDKIEKLENMEVRVGVFKEDGEDLLMIARVHEYGAQIKVTQKMRDYLHYIGLHLKATTTEINIPERSYIRSTVDDNKKIIKKDIGLMLKKYLTTNRKFKHFTSEVGNYLTNITQKQLMDLHSPKLHPFTVQKKGQDNPLLETGELVNQITYKVVM